MIVNKETHCWKCRAPLNGRWVKLCVPCGSAPREATEEADRKIALLCSAIREAHEFISLIIVSGADLRAWFAHNTEALDLAIEERASRGEDDHATTKGDDDGR